MNGTLVEKNLCYVAIEANGSSVEAQCNANGMRLYRPYSSADATRVLQSYVASLNLKGQKPDVYVFGGKNDKCAVIRANEKVKNTPCFFSHTSFCEYFEPSSVECESYVPVGTGFYVDVTGIDQPQACIYKTPVTESGLVLRSSSAVAKESIVIVDVEDVTASEYLNVGFGSTFPNLQYLRADGCNIKEITRASFEGLTRIKFIDLDYNQITVISSSVFAGLTSLVRLDLGRIEFNEF